MRLALTGDVMLGRLTREHIDKFGPKYVWGDLLPSLKKADLRLINLECAITETDRRWSRWPKAFYFRTSHLGADALKFAGIDYASLANNHILDYREEGLFDTLRALDERGIKRAGGGADLGEAREPAWLQAAGKRVAVFSATDNEPQWAAGPNEPGTYYLEIEPNESNLRPVRESIAQARSQGADLIIFSLHWGPNMVQRPPRRFRLFARELIKAGVDIIHGHSSHIVQGIEFYRGKPIIYDAGEFVDDYAVDPLLRNDLSFLFTVVVTWKRGKLETPGIELLPIFIDECRVNQAPAAQAAFIKSVMTGLCRELGTEVRDQDDLLIVEPALRGSS